MARSCVVALPPSAIAPPRVWRVTIGDSQVGRGEGPKRAVQAIRDALVLLRRVPKNHHFALGEVNGEAEHVVEA